MNTMNKLLPEFAYLREGLNHLPEDVYWSPFSKVVQSHGDGTVYFNETNMFRQKVGLPTPWTPAMSHIEIHMAQVHHNAKNEIGKISGDCAMAIMKGEAENNLQQKMIDYCKRYNFPLL